MINKSQLNKFYKKLKDDVINGFSDIQSKLVEEVDSVIETPGIFDSFPDSDIVDTGRLRDSKIVDSKPLSLEMSWQPKSPKNGYSYAPAVWSGFYAYGRKYIPGRQWDLLAVDNIEIANYMAKILERKGYEITDINQEYYLK